MSLIVRIIRPSSREKNDLLPERIHTLEAHGVQILYDESQQDASWPYTAAPARMRAESLQSALLETTSNYVLAARGGYGASDLLELIDWKALGAAQPKPLIGFSDVSALHSALYAKLGWVGIHGPMPATVLWGKDGEKRDWTQLLDGMRSRQWRGSIAVEPITGAATTKPIKALSGKLFGGCLSVLSGLIGTPFFPKSLGGHILFFEDTGENPARLMRYWNQWIQSGALRGVVAVVLGQFRDLGNEDACLSAKVNLEFARRSGLPVFASPDFGHVCPNFPLGIGTSATLTGGKLSWEMISQPSTGKSTPLPMS